MTDVDAKQVQDLSGGSRFQQMLQDVCARIERLDPTWVRKPGIPVEGEMVKFNIAPWFLGFREKDAVKGKSQIPQILLVGVNVGSVLPPFNVRHNVGFARSPSGSSCVPQWR